jgi:hypothetical protein
MIKEFYAFLQTKESIIYTIAYSQGYSDHLAGRDFPKIDNQSPAEGYFDGWEDAANK